MLEQGRWGWAGRQRTGVLSGPWLFKDIRLNKAAAALLLALQVQIHFDEAGGWVSELNRLLDPGSQTEDEK